MYIPRHTRVLNDNYYIRDITKISFDRTINLLKVKLMYHFSCDVNMYVYEKSEKVNLCLILISIFAGGYFFQLHSEKLFITNYFL